MQKLYLTKPQTCLLGGELSRCLEIGRVANLQCADDCLHFGLACDLDYLENWVVGTEVHRYSSDRAHGMVRCGLLNYQLDCKSLQDGFLVTHKSDWAEELTGYSTGPARCLPPGATLCCEQSARSSQWLVRMEPAA